MFGKNGSVIFISMPTAVSADNKDAPLILRPCGQCHVALTGCVLACRVNHIVLDWIVSRCVGVYRLKLAKEIIVRWSERLWLVLGLTAQREDGELGEWRVGMSLRERTSLFSHRPCHYATRHRRLGRRLVFSGTIGLV